MTSLLIVLGNVYRIVITNMLKIKCAIYTRKSAERGLVRAWQLKRLLEYSKASLRECEKASGMNKRTFARYLNLCYLSPRIVADILGYKNPANLTLRELMNLADSQMDFTEQKKAWSQ